MSAAPRRLPRPRDERGTSVVPLLSIAFTVLALVGVVLAQVVHLGQQTGLDRRRTQAFHVAEAGIDRAFRGLAADPGFSGSSEDVSAGGITIGGFQTQVSVTGDLERLVVSTGTAGGDTRRIAQTVTLDPLGEFDFALFSNTSISASEHLIVGGDTFSNDTATFLQHTDVVGNIVSPSSVTTGNNSTIDGDIRSGGDVFIHRGTTVNGNVYATGDVTVEGHVTGDVQAQSITACDGCIEGTATAGVSVPAPLTRSLPTYTYNPIDYWPDVPTEMDPATFTAYWAANRTAMSGVFHVTGPTGDILGPVQRTTLAGDLTIITDRPVAIQRDFVTSDGSTRRLTVISTSTSDSPPAIDWTNNVTLPPTVQTFIYSLGTVRFANQKNFHGIVYAQRIEQGQFFTVTFEPDLREDPPKGFTWTLASALEFDILPGVWRECNDPAGSC